MSLRVNTNIAAMNAYRNLTVTEASQGKSLEKLSSGLRINRAADDAAGLVNSEALRSQVGGLKVATRNAQDGISVAQTAEGSLNEVTSILQRMRDLAVQKSNTGSNSTTANDAMDAEFTALATEIDRIGKATTFNGNKLLDGTFGKSTTDSDGVTTTNGGSFQVGANQGETIGLDLGGIKLTSAGRDATTGQLNSPVDTDPSTSPGIADSLVDYVAAVDAGTDANGAATPAVAAHYTMAADTINKVDAALKSVSTARGTLGAFQNRMEHTIANLGVAVENLSASESRIRDTDMAQEMTSFSKSQILSQAGTAMLAQANQSSQGVLSLLRG